MSKDNALEYIMEIEGQKVRYQPIIEIKCAFCSLKATAIRLENGNLGVMHVKPQCSEFMIMDPATFLRENRKIFEREIKEGKLKSN